MFVVMFSRNETEALGPAHAHPWGTTYLCAYFGIKKELTLYFFMNNLSEAAHYVSIVVVVAVIAMSLSLSDQNCCCHPKHNEQELEAREKATHS